MSSILTRRYASALLQVGKEHDLLDEFLEQYAEMINQIKKEKKFEQLLNSPRIIHSQKKKIINEVFANTMNSYFLNFIYVLIDKGRLTYLEEIFLDFKEMVYKEKDILPIKVVSAIPLKEEQLVRVKEKLTKILKKEILIQNKVDPSIIGGLIVYAGDKILDGSIKSKIAKLKVNLKEIRLQEIGVN
ncbi:F0F1 ATP synthase subunit delta [Garciella nitratireducens]|uniref:ATP synthase subunit delta n=1 Tax=Garciella nitratireducens DSM 15102 TaxID=1121911 RepID=A0A1T4ML09_9FIRM|nr:F0F1 ATP synthase subunit delta [Garciella nitratireducens]RBP37807.1 ATP synthase F1 subcomplex delta subunit [Garciella nitratireducens]SJZ67547.1 ATP synthase F1 subcomplex delta subunit [Garciella nitratireducens DSM 15102]